MTITNTDKDKVKGLISESVQTLSDIEDLKAGLKDTIKTFADEMQVEPKDLTKAINLAFKQSKGKGSFSDEQEAMNAVEQILFTAGYLSSMSDD